jgi:hypothetical protein
MMNKKLVVLSVVAVLMSSCAAHLPEFQEIESLGKGSHRGAAGIFGGAPWGEIGASAFHSVGVSEATDWSTQGTYMYAVNSDFNSGMSLLTGPKVRLNDGLALSIPAGTYIQRDSGVNYSSFLATPTLYIALPSKTPGLTQLIFIRSELIGDQDADWYGWATVGYKRSLLGANDLRTALNVNITYIGIYGGLTFDLFR